MGAKAAMTVTKKALLAEIVRRDKRPRTLSPGLVGLALFVLVTGVDFHGSSLSGWTYESPHPVFVTCGHASQTGHVEEASVALAPGHEPALRSRPVVIEVLIDSHPTDPDRDAGRPLSASREYLPAAGHRLPPAPRGPPLV
jgi:hypothetical protein